MPTPIKAILSILVAITAIAAHFFQASVGQETTPWLVLVLGAFMIMALWLFPEAGNKNSKR